MIEKALRQGFWQASNLSHALERGRATRRKPADATNRRINVFGFADHEEVKTSGGDRAPQDPAPSGVELVANSGFEAGLAG